MPRYLLTHSLLSSWLYAIKDSPYEDATTERDAFGEFMQALRREPTPTTEAMQRGIDFENLVTTIVNGGKNISPDYDKWYSAAQKVAEVVRGGCLQYKAKKEVQVSGITLLLYGRLDALKAGTIYDIKFSGSYERGKFINSTQHPVYLEIMPEAQRFAYIVSNGTDVWTEWYNRKDAPSIFPVISDFLEWLRTMGLLDIYKEKWLAK